MENKQIKKFPRTPGVYFFRDARGRILYIGKATSLRDRVKSYFNADVIDTRGPQIVGMIQAATKADYIPTDSVLEALILEAHLIKKHQPRYNTKEKDDKSFNFVVITKEDFPRVLLVRGKELFHPLKKPSFIARDVFGPFPQGSVLKTALGIMRKIFPWRDTCTPLSGKPCFNAQIGLCPGVCAGAISKKEYAREVRCIKLFFEGKKGEVVSSLKKDMKNAVKELRFEDASRIQKTLFALAHIQDVALIKNEVRQYTETMRIEAYDIAHTAGEFAVGVMTVVENGIAVPSEYKKFRIKSFKGVDDTRALIEVLERRLAHPEWRYPRLIVADGGKAQKNALERVLRASGVEIPVVGVVKDEHHRPKNILGEEGAVKKYEQDILLVNAEAHRFAIAYHRALRGRI